MNIFNERQLKQFVEAVFQKYDLGDVTIIDGSLRHRERVIEFEGFTGRMRKQHTFAMPTFELSYGVIGVRSVLCAANRNDLSWMLNGQSLNSKTKELVHVGENGITLHIDKAMLRAWTHGRLDNAPDELSRGAWLKAFDMTYDQMIGKKLYGDEVAVGDYIDAGPEHETLQLRLQPLSGGGFSFDLPEDVRGPSL